MANPKKINVKKNKRVDYIYRQLEQECDSLCMDNEEDRWKMAEWIEMHFRI